MPDLAIFVHALFGGGAERAMLNLARGFSQRGIAVDLVLLREEGAYLEQVPPDVRIINLGGRRLWQSLPALGRYLQQHRPSAMLSTLDDTNLAAICIRRLTGVNTRLIVNVQNTISQEAQRSKTLKTRLMPALVKYFFPGADSVIPVSEGVATDLRQLGVDATKIHVIHNPVVTPELFEQAQVAIHHPWFAAGQPPVIMSMGRLVPQKDYPTLLQAFAKVRQTHSVRLMILGEGPDRPVLEAQIQALGLSDAVALPGFVSNPYAYLSQAALFVLSSQFEGLPTVLIEAMAVGTPVVATDCKSGPAEILAEGQYGALVDVGNVEQLAAALVQTLESPMPANQLRSRANQYSLEHALDQYAQILHLRSIHTYAASTSA